MTRIRIAIVGALALAALAVAAVAAMAYGQERNGAPDDRSAIDLPADTTPPSLLGPEEATPPSKREGEGTGTLPDVKTDAADSPQVGGGSSGTAPPYYDSGPGGSSIPPLRPQPPTDKPTGPDTPVELPAPITREPGSAGGRSPAWPPAPPPSPGITPPAADRHNLPAPIDGVEVLTRTSLPAQYSLKVLAGLPGGCALPAGYELRRSGSSIEVVVMNSLPSGPVACTMIYGMYELNIDLGRLQSGTAYTIKVNDKTLRLEAQ